MAQATNKIAVVTGANKGIGLEICRQLASKGITVVLTARDEKRGMEAVEKLRGSVPLDSVIFHQLDVTDSGSVVSLAEFIKSQFGKLDILVNNAGILGAIITADNMQRLTATPTDNMRDEKTPSMEDLIFETYELAAECLETNYYGARRTTEALLTLLQISDSPRIVNVSSFTGILQNIPSQWVKGVLSDSDHLTEERIDQVISKYLKDFKEDSIVANGWPQAISAYIISKAAMNAYTRILAKKYPSFRINCVCPGHVKTDISFNTGIYSAEEGAESVVGLALLPEDGPTHTGLFFHRNEVNSF